MCKCTHTYIQRPSGWLMFQCARACITVHDWCLLRLYTNAEFFVWLYSAFQNTSQVFETILGRGFDGVLFRSGAHRWFTDEHGAWRGVGHTRIVQDALCSCKLCLTMGVGKGARGCTCTPGNWKWWRQTLFANKMYTRFSSRLRRSPQLSSNYLA